MFGSECGTPETYRALCGVWKSITMAESQTLMVISKKTKAKEERDIKMAQLMGRPPLVGAVEESDPGLVIASVNYDKIILENRGLQLILETL